MALPPSEYLTPSGHPSSSTTHHIYHEGYQEHILVSPVPKPSKKERAKAKKKPACQLYLVKTLPRSQTTATSIHRPYLAFHNPPRTLRRGPSKTTIPACLIQMDCSLKKWTLQFGKDLAKVIDFRGVVALDRLNVNATTADHCCRGDGTVQKKKKGNSPDDHALRVYRVRSWRLCGESGKQYHREVNTRRSSRPDHDNLA